MVSLTPGVPFFPQQKTGCGVSVLRIMVLEVSTAQVPSLSLLRLCPHPHADCNQYLQGLQLLPSLQEDPAFLVLPERQRRSAQGRPGQGPQPSALESWARPLVHEKDVQNDSIQAPESSWPRLWACLASGSLAHQGPHPMSSWLDLGLELCLCPQVLKAELIFHFRPRGTGRPSAGTP